MLIPHAGVHLQAINDEGQMMKKLVDTKKNIALFIVPALLDKTLVDSEGKLILGNVYSESNYYRKWTINFLRDNKDNSQFTFVQEGYLHYCEPCFEEFEKNGGRAKDAWPDPFHEDFCLNGHKKDITDLMKSIFNGKDTIKRVTGITPKYYCSANHLFNDYIITAAWAEEFKGIFTRNVVGLPIYFEAKGESSILIIPEAKLGEREISPMIATYYDHLVSDEKKWGEFEKVLMDSYTRDFEVSEKPFFKAGLNQVGIRVVKKLRDLKKYYLK